MEIVEQYPAQSTGVLAVNRTAIFNLVRIAPENIHKTPAAHLEFVNRTMTTNFNSKTELMPLPSAAPVISREDVDKQLAAERGEFVEGISDPTDPKWETTHRMATTTHEENLQRIREEGARRRAEEVKEQPEITSMGNGMFSIEGLLNQSASNEVEKRKWRPPAMCRFKRITVMKNRLVMRCHRAKSYCSQVKAVLTLVRNQLP